MIFTEDLAWKVLGSRVYSLTSHMLKASPRQGIEASISSFTAESCSRGARICRRNWWTSNFCSCSSAPRALRERVLPGGSARDSFNELFVCCVQKQSSKPLSPFFGVQKYELKISHCTSHTLPPTVPADISRSTIIRRGDSHHHHDRRYQDGRAQFLFSRNSPEKKIMEMSSLHGHISTHTRSKTN